MSRRRWVFCVHTLEQVGPPVYLAHLLEWVAGHDPEVELDVISLADGPMSERFSRVARVTIATDPSAALPVNEADLICVHTVNTAQVLPRLEIPGAPVVVHAHEMTIGLDYHLPPRHREIALARADHWIAASGPVADALECELGIDREAIAIHHEMVAAPAPPARSASEVRSELGVAPDAALVGCAAVMTWRKGPDLFLSLARALRTHRERMGRDLRLLWVGGSRDQPDVAAFRRERDAAGLTDLVVHVPTTPDPMSWIAALDVFALTAREDAFPLACLEAGSVGVPVVCFDAGGMRELVDGDTGAVLPYPDVEAMASTIAGLLGDPVERQRRGRALAARVGERHLAPVAAPHVHAQLSAWERT